MPTTYNGIEQTITARPAFSISEPAGTDVRNSASVRTPLEKLADWAHTLIQKAALLNVTNAFAATQQIATGDLELTNAGAQALLKAGGGKIQVGTKTGNNSDVEVVVNGVVKATIRASDGKLVLPAQVVAQAGLDANSQPIANVPDPSAAQHPVTRNWLDGSSFVANVTFGTNWNGSVEYAMVGGSFWGFAMNATANGSPGSPIATISGPVAVPSGRHIYMPGYVITGGTRRNATFMLNFMNWQIILSSIDGGGSLASGDFIRILETLVHL